MHGFFIFKNKIVTMSYIRIYPNKNNTLFKTNYGNSNQTTGLINVGKNPVFELNDGAGYSKIALGFDLEVLKEKLQGKSFTCNLCLYDAGALRNIGREGAEKIGLKSLKPINIYYFTSEFVEGDGFQFVEPLATTGVSNWVARTNNDQWTTEFLSPIQTIQLQSKTDDLKIKNLESYVLNSINNDLECNFGLGFDVYEIDDVLITKFIYSRHTKTIFQPYLEVFINDTIKDGRYSLKQGEESTLYLVNQNQEEISGLSVEVQNMSSSFSIQPTITYVGNGIYSYNFTPTEVGEYIETWKVNAVGVNKSILTVKPNYNFQQESYSNLYFYPTSYYKKNLVRKGDIVKMSVISKKDSKQFLSSDYEYKIVTTSDFEITPWQPVSVCNNEIYFHIDTSYFYEEIEYEVIIRLKNKDRVQTGATTYKFRVIYDGTTRFDNIHASPYSDRNIYLKR